MICRAGARDEVGMIITRLYLYKVSSPIGVTVFGAGAEVFQHADGGIHAAKSEFDETTCTGIYPSLQYPDQ